MSTPFSPRWQPVKVRQPVDFDRPTFQTGLTKILPNNAQLFLFTVTFKVRHKLDENLYIKNVVFKRM